MTSENIKITEINNVGEFHSSFHIAFLLKYDEWRKLRTLPCWKELNAFLDHKKIEDRKENWK